jgi:hypothetical protein
MTVLVDVDVSLRWDRQRTKASPGFVAAVRGIIAEWK